MIEWHIGINTDFTVPVGKLGKYFKKYLLKEFYAMYSNTYSYRNYDNFWAVILQACDLFKIVAKLNSEHFGYIYNQNKDSNMIVYLNKVKNKCISAEV